MINTTARSPRSGEASGVAGWSGRVRSIAAQPITGPSVSAIGVTLVGLAVFGLWHGNYNDSELVVAVVYGFVLLGLVVQLGVAHQLAFSQSVFMAFGAYSVAVLNTKYAWPVPAAMAASVAASVVLGTIMGRAVSKVPGFALALATLFFSTIVGSVLIYSNYLGGTSGLGGIAPLWTGSSFTSTLERSGLIVIILFGVCFFICARIIKSGIGLELSLLGTNEAMAESVGVLTRRRKLETFVLGCALATLGGAAFAGTQAYVSNVTFSQIAQLTLLIMLFIGGRASLFGGLLGALGIEFLQGSNNFVATNLPIFEGVILTLVLLFAPGGLIEIVKRLVGFLYRLVRRFLRSNQPTDAIAEQIPELPVDEPVAPAGAFGSEESAVTAAVDGAELDEARDLLRHATIQDRRLSVATNGSADLSSGDFAQLECQNVTKRFGGLVAVDDVSLSIHGTGIHAICGPNGAGKTTLFELIAGGIPLDSGRVFIQGRDATKMLAHQRAELGMARTRQAVRLMPMRSVADNVAVAALKSHHTFLLRSVVHSDLKEAYERAHDALHELGISHMANLRPAQLTLEAQRMVEFARAIVTKPKLLLLDEPASGLSTEQRVRLSDTLVTLGENMTVVLVEHDLQLVARISTEVFVLIHGRLEFHGSSSQFLESPLVRSELMGLLADTQPIVPEPVPNR